MLPNLEHLAGALLRLRISADRAHNPSTWMNDADDAVTYLTLTGITGHGPAHADAFQHLLTEAANRHGWKADFIARIVESAAAVHNLIDSSSSTGHVNADAFAQKVIADTQFPAFIFTRDPAPVTANNGLVVGRTADGTPFQLPPGATIACARRGGGRTVFMHNLIAAIAQSSDATAWVADPNGGLIAPWLQTENTRRLIGWAASTTESIQAMLSSAIAVVQHRARTMSDVMFKRNLDRWPASSTEPAVYVIVDAHIEELGHATWELVHKLFRIGRSVGVYIVIGTHKPTADWLPGTLRAMADNRLGGIMETQSHYDFLFGVRGVVAPTQPGVFVMQTNAGDGAEQMARFRTALVRPTEIVELADVLSDEGRRPADLQNTRSREVLTGYETRWDDPVVQEIINSF